jgi:hypothetical protein
MLKSITSGDPLTPQSLKMNALCSCERSGNTNPDPTGAFRLPAGARFQRHVSVRTFYYTRLSSARNAMKARELTAVADPPEVSTSSLTTRFLWLVTCVSQHMLAASGRWQGGLHRAGTSEEIHVRPSNMTFMVPCIIIQIL